MRVSFMLVCDVQRSDVDMWEFVSFSILKVCV